MSKEIKEYDEKGNLIYFNEIFYKNSSGFERWMKYDKNNNEIYYKNSNNWECWKKYDDRGNLIYLRKFNGRSYYEEWTEYNEDNKEIYYRDTRYFLIGEYYKYDNGGN